MMPVAPLNGPIRPPLQSPSASPTPAANPPPLPWNQVVGVLNSHFHAPDLEAARAVYSAIAAHDLSGHPVWVMLIGPPGSAKTELLQALDGLPSTHSIDQVTPRTFISGYVDDRLGAARGLLHRIGPKGIIFFKDFSTVLAMHADSRGSILADLRRIYDGHLRKEFGNVTGEQPYLEWRGRITLAAACTEDIDRQYAAIQSLGERFVNLRLPRAAGVDAALVAMNQKATTARQALGNAVHSLLSTLPPWEPTLSPVLQTKIASLAEIAVRARTYIPRDGKNKQIISVPQPESPTRLAQQLCQLSKGSALLDRRPDVNDLDFELAKRVAFDCIPPVRRKVLDGLIAGEVRDSIRLPASTKSYAFEELFEMDLIEADSLSSLARHLFKEAGIATP